MTNSNPNIKNLLILIQARMTSRRFPGKSMRLLQGQPLIQHLGSRARFLNAPIILLFPDETESQPLIEWAQEQAFSFVVGERENVLSRFCKAIHNYAGAPEQRIILRLTGDCPFIDPFIVLKMMHHFLTFSLDYLNNTEIPSYPHGLDAEIFWAHHLLDLDQSRLLDEEKEHVTLALRRSPTLKKGCFVMSKDVDPRFRAWRWCVDYPADLHFLQALWQARYGNHAPYKISSSLTHAQPHYAWRGWIPTLLAQPDLLTINSKHQQRRDRNDHPQQWHVFIEEGEATTENSRA